jgi:hypothetical protein
VQDLKEGEDPKEVEAGLPKVDVGIMVVGVVIMEVDVGIMEVVVVVMVVGVVVVVGFPNSSMVGLLSIKEGAGEDLHSHNSSMVGHLSFKAEAGEDLLSKEVADMVVAVADTVVVWVLAVAMT